MEKKAEKKESILDYLKKIFQALASWGKNLLLKLAGYETLPQKTAVQNNVLQAENLDVPVKKDKEKVIIEEPKIKSSFQPKTPSVKVNLTVSKPVEKKPIKPAKANAQAIQATKKSVKAAKKDEKIAKAVKQQEEKIAKKPKGKAAKKIASKVKESLEQQASKTKVENGKASKKKSVSKGR